MFSKPYLASFLKVYQESVLKIKEVTIRIESMFSVLTADDLQFYATVQELATKPFLSFSLCYYSHEIRAYERLRSMIDCSLLQEELI